MTITDQFTLHGRVAMVTGPRTGIGHAITLALAEAGADIVTVSRGDCTETREKVVALGRRCRTLRADLATSQQADIEALVDQAATETGGIDILINNAGIIGRGAALEVTQDSWQEVLHVNLTAPFFIAQAVARQLVMRKGRAERNGKIINIASLLSFQGGINVAAYTASKSAIAGITRLLANEWAPHGINVNALAPGYIVTKATAALSEDPIRSKEITERIPAGRWGRPADLQGASVFLASPASDYVHGIVLPVDGGWLAR